MSLYVIEIVVYTQRGNVVWPSFGRYLAALDIIRQSPGTDKKVSQLPLHLNFEQ